MQHQKCRIRTSARLFGFALLAAGILALPLVVPHLEGHRDWIKSIRAWRRGAYYVGEAGMVLQTRGNDCGAACLKMVLSAHGIERSLSDLALQLKMTPRGASMLDLRVVAAGLGLQASSWILDDTDLDSVPLPAIALINEDHFVVIRGFVAPEVLEVDDPALGKLQWPLGSFRRRWQGKTLIFDPTRAPP